jgi:hypothetical protein
LLSPILITSILDESKSWPTDDSPIMAEQTFHFYRKLQNLNRFVKMSWTREEQKKEIIRTSFFFRFWSSVDVNRKWFVSFLSDSDDRADVGFVVYVLFTTVVTAGASVQKNDSTFDTEQLKFLL